jgi:hypothetical protein
VSALVAIEAVGFIGTAHMQGIDIGIGIDGDGLHAIVGAGSRDAHGDLATVGNQNFVNHGCHLRKHKTGMRDRRRCAGPAIW